MQLGTDDLIECDHEIIYDQNHDRKKAFGIIEKLTIGTHEIGKKTKWKVHLPHDHKEKHVIVVLTSFQWDGGQMNEMIFKGFCSPHVRSEILGLLSGKKLKDSFIELSFEIFKYDEVKAGEKKGGKGGYYKSRWTTSEVKGYIPINTFQNNHLMFNVFAARDDEPQRCRTEFHIKPAAGHENHIHVAEEEGHKHVQHWGHKHD